MEEKENDQDNYINNINAYSDYEHEAESIYISSPNDEDKKESNQIQKNDIPPEQRIADLKKKTEEAVKLTVKTVFVLMDLI